MLPPVGASRRLAPFARLPDVPMNQPAPLPSSARSPARASAPLSQSILDAAHLLRELRAGRTSSETLPQLPAQRRPAAQALFFATLRHLGAAQALIHELAQRADPRSHALLSVAVAILHANLQNTEQNQATSEIYPPHIWVHQCVDAARRAGINARTGAFINACLRRLLREHASLWQRALSGRQASTARHNHPDWWVQLLQRQYPHAWQNIVQQNRIAAPMFIRVARHLKINAADFENHENISPPHCEQFKNSTQDNHKDNQLDDILNNPQYHLGHNPQRDRFIPILAQANIAATALGPDGLWLQRAVPVTALPGFETGHLSVQDTAAQLAAPLLLAGRDDAPDLADIACPTHGLRILDACAAPGGKTAHLIDIARAQGLPHVQVTALEVDARRAQRLRQTLERTRTADAACVITADAAQPSTWLGPQRDALFDAILLDAPCTASGIVRRRPDVTWLRRASDVDQLAATQAHLLRALWPLLKPRGRLLYATCSVFKQEGDYQIRDFCAQNPDAQYLPSPGHLLPCTQHDGFFYALMVKKEM